AAWRVPFCLVTGAGAVALLLVAARSGQSVRPVMPLGRVLRNAPWQIVLFSLGMYLVVYGLGQAGLTAYGAAALEWLGAQGRLVATVGTGFLAAITASVMNNMPSTLVGALAIDHISISDPVIRQLMIYANVIGNDLGPKFTPIGSLATLLWLHVLAGKGHDLSWGQYMTIGLIITPPVLLATLIALALWLPMLPPM